MSTKNILYFPWFREAQNKKMPWVIIWNYLSERNRAFSRIILPGDTINTDRTSLFSMTRVQEQVIWVLNCLQDDTSITTYSLSTIPVLEALHHVSSDVRKKVVQVIFLHPTKNPLSAVAMMDWSLSSNPYIFEEKHYLEGDKEKVFSTLIGDWRGDASQFQSDLWNYYEKILVNRRYFDARILELRDDIPDIQVLENINDMIVSQWKKCDVLERRGKERTQLSHIPNLSLEVLERIFA